MDDSKFALKHEPARSFTSGVITGATISGPSGDGMLHVTFYRDAYRIVADNFTRESTGGSSYALTPIPGGTELDFYREDLATVAMTPKVFHEVYEAFRQAVERTPNRS